MDKPSIRTADGKRLAPEMPDLAAFQQRPVEKAPGKRGCGQYGKRFNDNKIQKSVLHRSLRSHISIISPLPGICGGNQKSL